MNKLNFDFYNRDILEVAEDIIGNYLVFHDKKYIISEIEVYRGEEDTACHANKGKTKRTKVLYEKAGTIYVYLCYGIHNMLNIVTGPIDSPQAILIRGLDNIYGPGKITKLLGIDRNLNNESIIDRNDIFIACNPHKFNHTKNRRIGVHYASEEDRNRLWNFKIEEHELQRNI